LIAPSRPSYRSLDFRIALPYCDDIAAASIARYLGQDMGFGMSERREGRSFVRAVLAWVTSGLTALCFAALCPPLPVYAQEHPEFVYRAAWATLANVGPGGSLEDAIEDGMWLPGWGPRRLATTAAADSAATSAKQDTYAYATKDSLVAGGWLAFRVKQDGDGTVRFLNAAVELWGYVDIGASASYHFDGHRPRHGMVALRHTHQVTGVSQLVRIPDGERDFHIDGELAEPGTYEFNLIFEYQIQSAATVDLQETLTFELGYDRAVALPVAAVNWGALKASYR
jgi:hypothetical protein